MGIGSEIDILLRKSDAVGLDKHEMDYLKALWENYRKFNRLYGVDVGTFEQLKVVSKVLL